MKNSVKNTYILAFVVIVVMCTLFYFVPYKNMNTEINVLNKVVGELSTSYDQLVQDIQQKEVLVASINETKENLKQYDLKLPIGLPQETILYQINDLEKEVGIHFPSLLMGPITSVVLPDETVATPVENETTPVEAAATEVEGQELAIVRNLTTSATLSYNQLKALMAYLYEESPESPKWRIVLNKLQLTNNQETKDLTADFDLSFYGLVKEPLTAISRDLGQYVLEKENVFTPYPSYGLGFTPTETATMPQEAFADFFIALEPLTTDKPSVTIGRTNDATRESYVYGFQADQIALEIEVYQESDTYYYKYKVGADSYPKQYETGIPFNPEQVLEIQILSSSRSGAADVSGANATIINKTDMPVNIVYGNKNEQNPRLNIVKMVGNVVIR